MIRTWCTCYPHVCWWNHKSWLDICLIPFNQNSWARKKKWLVKSPFVSLEYGWITVDTCVHRLNHHFELVKPPLLLNFQPEGPVPWGAKPTHPPAAGVPQCWNVATSGISKLALLIGWIGGKICAGNHGFPPWKMTGAFWFQGFPETDPWIYHLTIESHTPYIKTPPWKQW